MSNSTSYTQSIDERLAEALHAHTISGRVLTGGSVAQVYAYQLSNDRQVVVKLDPSNRPMLSIEAEMLHYLAQHSNLPVPAVLHSDPDMLVIEYLPGNSRLGMREQQHAAQLVAELHQISAPFFGLTYDTHERFDTLIGGLPQPNPPTASWVEFFRDQRLMYMAGEAALAGQLPTEMLPRLDRLASDLPKYLHEPAAPSLIHGDLWTTNILATNGRITGFIDPAIYYADPEVELAFSTLFSTFSEPFFEVYQEIRPLAPGFFEMRRDIYNLYPLLVHTRLFGGSYVQGIARILKRFGY